MKASSRNEVLGKNGEKFVNNVFERLIGKKRLKKGWYKIKHQDWAKNYNYGTGTDIKIYEDNLLLVDVEVKNWKHQDRPYGTEIAISEILDRFTRSFAPVKLLIISFLSLLTNRAKELLRQSGIQTLEMGNWIVRATWAETYKQFVMSNYYRLRKLLNIKKHRFYSSSVNSSVNLNHKSSNYSKLIRKHDTNIVKLTGYTNYGNVKVN